MKSLINGLVFLVLIFLLGACDRQLSDVEYVEKAQIHLDEGSWKAAAVQLKNAIQSNPDNAQARWLLGKLYVDLGDAEGAEKELLRAEELGVATGSVYPLLARALLLKGDVDALLEMKAVLVNSPAQRAEVIAAQGLGQLARGENDAAGDLVASALALAPDSPYVIVANARLSATRKETAEARRAVATLLQRSPGYAPAWTLLAELEVLDKQWEKAEAAYTESIKNRTDKRLDRLSRALIRIQRGDLEAAQSDLDQLRKQIPNDATFNYAQGLVRFRQKRLEEAKEAFERVLKANDTHALALYHLGLIHLKLGSLEQAQEFSSRYLARVPGSVPGRKLAATLALGEGRHLEAERLMRPVVQYFGEDTDALNLLASAYMGEGRFDQALTLLSRVVKLQPDSAAAHENLGRAMLKAGKPAEGVSQVRQSIAIDPDFSQAYLTLIAHYLGEDQVDQALVVARRYRDRFPDAVAAWNLVGRLELVHGKLEKAGETFRKALDLSPDDVLANFSLAAMAVKAGQYQVARQYYRDVLKGHSQHLGALLNLATLDAFEGNEKQMADRLQQAATQYPREPQPLVMLARYYLLKREPGKVQPLMVTLEDAQKTQPDVLEVLALSQIALQQYAEARYSLESLMKKRPGAAPLQFLLAHVYSALGERDKALLAVQKTLELDPGHIQARLVSANIKIREGKTGPARDDLAVLEQRAPADPKVLQLKAALSQLEGDPLKASAILEEAFEKFPDTSSLLALARQKWQIAHERISLDLEERWVRKHPEDVAAGLALAGFYTRLGETDKAIGMYRQVLRHDKGNVIALNDLAWLLRDRRPEEASRLASRASDLAPDSAGILDTLALVQMSSGDTERARRTIERAMRAAPDNPSIQFHGAQIAHAAGDVSGAGRLLESLLKNATEFPEREQAEELLQRLTTDRSRS